MSQQTWNDGDSGEVVKGVIDDNFTEIYNVDESFVNYGKLLGLGYCVGIPADGGDVIVKTGADAPQEVIDLMPDSTSVGGRILLGSSKALPGGIYNYITLTGG